MSRTPGGEDGTAPVSGGGGAGAAAAAGAAGSGGGGGSADARGANATGANMQTAARVAKRFNMRVTAPLVVEIRGVTWSLGIPVVQVICRVESWTGRVSKG
ncbi:hypothetical protein FZI95_26850 [Mycobacterium sp. CBMA247]|nr:hypothetical protein [Mycolicibacterium sp. CBMA 329]MUL90465.1 hypothetical protein [Mycolicibacterium sp. CBMA 331]MUM00437.1 hypothetical protein [Mycolicibacterium sp. CBMA 334]MUM28732.1 hypothetical protein [Mycolicibacterium sp. CBMA 295]MUM41409.1 hypothetical protein [Mycolicibacterium sp. CBMA 247]MUM45873.1 hypothetical protein [Mycolicibacterium sp. CBMA 294]